MLTLICKKRWNVETYGVNRVKVSYLKFKNGEATVRDVMVEPNLGKPLELQMLTLNCFYKNLNKFYLPFFSVFILLQSVSYMPELFGFLTPNCTWVIPLKKTAALKKQTRSYFWAKIESLDMLYTWKFFNFEIWVSLLQELRWGVSIIDRGWNVTPIPKEWAQMDFSSLILPNMSDFPTCHFQITVTSAGLYMQEQEKTRFNFAYNVDKNYKPSVSFLPNQLPFDTWWDQK